jgi:hypothetical protein
MDACEFKLNRERLTEDRVGAFETVLQYIHGVEVKVLAVDDMF